LRAGARPLVARREHRDATRTGEAARRAPGPRRARHARRPDRPGAVLPAGRAGQEGQPGRLPLRGARRRARPDPVPGRSPRPRRELRGRRAVRPGLLPPAPGRLRGPAAPGPADAAGGGVREVAAPLSRRPLAGRRAGGGRRPPARAGWSGSVRVGSARLDLTVRPEITGAPPWSGNGAGSERWAGRI